MNNSYEGCRYVTILLEDFFFSFFFCGGIYTCLILFRELVMRSVMLW